MSKSTEKKHGGKKIGILIISILIGAVCGFLIGEYTSRDMIKHGRSLEESLCLLAVLFIGIYVAYFLQIVIHESGHLVFGLLTGYRFYSFCVGSLMLVRTDGKLKFQRMSLAGVGGQCQMIAQKRKDGRVPYILYYLGGALLNLISAILFCILALLCQDAEGLRIFLLLLSLMGVICVVMNGIPFQTKMLNNDGYTVQLISKSPEALHSYYIQMKIMEQNISGIRLRDMPEEWFELPSEESMKNSMIATGGMFACNRVMDQMKFEETDQMIEKLFSMDIELIGLYRNLLINDQIYCKLVSTNNQEQLEKLLDKQQQKFMKMMKNFPTILRTEYAYALLAEHNEAKAQNIRDRFQEIAKRYPCIQDIESELELFDYAEDCFKKHKCEAGRTEGEDIL